MKKIILFFFFLLVMRVGFADSLLLDNKTSYPAKTGNSKMAIQWANSGKEVDEGNAWIYGSELNLEKVQILKQSGKVKLTIPHNAEYFRLLVWSNGEGQPDLITNWVEVVSSKTYLLKQDHLTPSILMLGTGC